MSTRPLDSNGGGGKEDTIWNVAETKGISDDIDHIEKEQSRTDEGERVTYFRIYTDLVTNDDGSIDERNSVGAQVTDFGDDTQGPNMFRQQVQRTLSELKRTLMDADEAVEDASQQQDELEQLAEQDDRVSGDPDPDPTPTDSDTDTSPTTVDTVDPDVTGGPGTQLDAQLADHEARLQEIESKLDDLDETLKALEALSELTSDS